MTETEQEWTVLAGVTEHLPSALLVLLFQVQTNLIILRAELRPTQQMSLTLEISKSFNVAIFHFLTSELKLHT